MIDTGIKEREGVDRKLPDGWKWVKVGEIATVVRGSSPRPKDDPMYYGGTVPRLMVADVTRDGMYVTPKIDFLTEEGAKLSRPMKKDDVVMVVSGAPGLPGILAVDACIHDGFVGFKNVDSTILLNTFFFSYLKFVHVSTDSQATGTIFRNLTTDQIKDIKIPLPPLAEQKRIAAILNEQMEAVEKARKATEAQLEAAKELPAAYLRAVFVNLELQQCKKRKLGEVCELVGGMQPPKSAFINNPQAGYVRLVQIQDFRRSDMAVYIPENEAKRNFDESDVMIGRYGPPVFQILRGLSGSYNVALMKADPKPDLLKDYLYYLLKEPKIQKAVTEQSQRTAGQSGVQKEFVENFLVLVPPLAEQKQIAAELSSKMANVETLEKSLKSQLEAINQLPSAILHKAFNGQL